MSGQPGRRFLAICHAAVFVSAATAAADPAPAAKDEPAAADANAVVTEANADDPTAKIALEYAATPDFDKLHTPDAPAFVILGVSPTQIQRPTTPTGVVIATIGGIASGTGSSIPIPKGLAVEFAPYWLVRHPELSMLHYREEALMRPVRTFSLSIGTAQSQRTETDAAGMSVDHTDSDLGVGFRTMVFQSNIPDPCTADALAMALSAGLSATELAEVMAAPPEKRDELHKKKIEKKVDTAFRGEKCVALAASPIGLSIDLAGALDLRFLDSELTSGSGRFAGYAMWSDVSYDTASTSTVAVARITGRKDGDVRQTMLDAGARGIFKTNQYAVSAEALIRHRFDMTADPANTYRVAAGFEVQIADGNWLSLTFGKDFSLGPDASGPWFSLANVHWDFGKPRF